MPAEILAYVSHVRMYVVNVGVPQTPVSLAGLDDFENDSSLDEFEAQLAKLDEGYHMVMWYKGVKYVARRDGVTITFAQVVQFEGYTHGDKMLAEALDAVMAHVQASQRVGIEQATSQITMQTFNTLPEAIGGWAAAEVKLNYEPDDYPASGEDMAPTFAMLIDHLPRFGSINGPWKVTTEPDEGDPGSEFIVSNVCPDYYVNGKQVQFMCAQGRCTFEPL